MLDDSLRRVKIWAGRRHDPVLRRADPHRRAVRPRRRRARRARHWSDRRRGQRPVQAREPPRASIKGKLLEVYLPIRTPDGTRVLFEAYYRYGLVEDNGAELWRSFAPIALGCARGPRARADPARLVARPRLRDRLREREHLLREALDASDRERRRIASDLHDGVVQDLAGVAYSLAAADRTGDGPIRRSAGEAADVIRRSVQSLRSLIVDIYPPDLEQVGLASALDRSPRPEPRPTGLHTHLEVDPAVDDRRPSLSGDSSTVSPRRVSATRSPPRPRHRTSRSERPCSDTALTIVVEDDGRGFDRNRSGDRWSTATTHTSASAHSRASCATPAGISTSTLRSRPRHDPDRHGPESDDPRRHRRRPRHRPHRPRSAHRHRRRPRARRRLPRRRRLQSLASTDDTARRRPHGPFDARHGRRRGDPDHHRQRARRPWSSCSTSLADDRPHHRRARRRSDRLRPQARRPRRTAQRHPISRRGGGLAPRSRRRPGCCSTPSGLRRSVDCGSQRSGARGPAPCRRRQDQQGHRTRARHHRADRQGAPHQRLTAGSASSDRTQAALWATEHLPPR